MDSNCHNTESGYKYESYFKLLQQKITEYDLEQVFDRYTKRIWYGYHRVRARFGHVHVLATPTQQPPTQITS